ncbi:hypothetical protein [Beggiatoa alba]|nr:hypothetical protein [Beggiatoa alba]
MKRTLKTLSLVIAFILPATNYVAFATDITTQSSRDTPLKVLNEVLGKPSSRDGLILTNQLIYYVGDPINISINLPDSLKPFLDKTAQLQLLLYFSTGDSAISPTIVSPFVMAIPVAAQGQFFESTIDTSTLSTGVYELGLVLVKPNGDATKVSDWYGGYGGLLSTVRLKVSEKSDMDDEDVNGDGLVEGDANGDGYVNTVVENNNSYSVADLLGSQSIEVSADAICNNALLEGTYTYLVHGLTRQGDYLKDYVELGFDIFDGKGNVTNVYTDNINRATYQSMNAKYNVDANCQAKVTYEDGSSFTMFVAPNGDEFYYLSAGEVPAESFGGREHRLTPMTNMHCSTATLNGVYSYASKGVKQGVLWIETGFEYFDGKGNVTAVFTNNVTKTTEFVRGAYYVDSNCLGVTTYSEENLIERYAMYVSASGDEFSWLQIDGIQLLGYLAGVEKRVARSVNTLKILANFTATSEPVDPNITDNMICNMPAPEQIPSNVEIKCGEGYDAINGHCELNDPDNLLYDGAPLATGPAALCAAGIRLKAP